MMNSRPFHYLLIATIVLWQVSVTSLRAQESVASESAEVAEQPIVPVAVVLTRNQSLEGTALDNDGKPAAGKIVVLGRDGKMIAKTFADDTGRFRFTAMRSGDYQIATAEAGAFVRCYQRSVAPEGAVPQVLVSRGAMIARGQQPASVLLHPLLIGLVIAAAIVIPIVVSNSDDAS
ncbi:MAG: carboxypeptidase-like regulatory domain-containing protein [Pirellulaceae bacterium]